MLYGPDGAPLRKAPTPNKTGMRRGNQVNGFELPEGAVVSHALSMKLHNMIRDNAKLREDIEKADKITGTETLHLAAMRRKNGMTDKIAQALMSNQIAGEMIMRERVKKDGESLNKSGEGYEKAAA